MMRRTLLAGTAFAVACGLAGATQASGPESSPCATLTDYRTVATRAVRTGKQIVAVDPDGRVLLLSVPSSGSKPDVEPLGYEQPIPSDFPYSQLLPKDEAVTTLRRVSCTDKHWRIWIAVTVGFPPEEARAHAIARPTSRLLVLRDPAASEGKPVQLDERFGENLELTVDDINEDQRTEIAAQYANDDGEWMKIWQVEGTGILRPIPLDNIKKDLTAVPGHVEIGLGDYRHGGELLFTEQRLQTVKGWHVTRRFYDWDDARQRYQLAEVVQSEEVTVK
jgi:hypothetical protein